MHRRDLLKLLLASAVAEAIDVEKLLWVPKPIITVPALPRNPNHIRFNLIGRDFLADIGAIFTDIGENPLYLNTGTASRPQWTLLRPEAAAKIQRLPETRRTDATESLGWYRTAFVRMSRYADSRFNGHPAQS